MLTLSVCGRLLRARQPVVPGVSRLLSMKRHIAPTDARRNARSHLSDHGHGGVEDGFGGSLHDKSQRMQRLREGLMALDQSTWLVRPLRIFTVVGVLGVLALYVNQDEIREYFAEEVAGVARTSMEDEELVRRAGVLATSVVADNAVRDQTTALLKASVQALLADPELRKQMLGYLSALFRDDQTKKAVSNSLYDLVQTPEVQQYMSEFFVTALQSQAVTNTVNDVAKSATQEVLADELVRIMASDALWDVVRGSVWKRAEPPTPPPTPPPK